MSQGLHTSRGEDSLKFKGANSKQERVDVGVAKNNFGWKLRGEKKLPTFSAVTFQNRFKSGTGTSYLTSFEADLNKHKNKIICHGDSRWPSAGCYRPQAAGLAESWGQGRCQLPTRPVLKHGPGSLARARLRGCPESPRSNEGEG